MLLCNRVVLRLRHLVRHRTAVLRGDVEETGVGCRQQLDLDCCSLGHGRPAFKKMKAVEAGGLHGKFWRETTNPARKVKSVLD